MFHRQSLNSFFITARFIKNILNRTAIAFAIEGNGYFVDTMLAQDRKYTAQVLHVDGALDGIGRAR